MIQANPTYEPKCPECRDTGWTGEHTVLPCPGPNGGGCLYKAARYGSAPGVPIDEAKASLNNYTLTADNGEGIKQARYFLDDMHPGLFLHGGVGTGKTRLACSVLNDLVKRGKPARFQRCPELLVKLTPGWDEESRLWDMVVDVPVLCLDDVGANQGTDFARRMLQTIYDARLDKGHRTIWTSNLDLDQLAEFLGDDRLPSRIAGNCKVVKMGGKDWRLKKAPVKPAKRPERPFSGWRKR